MFFSCGTANVSAELPLSDTTKVLNQAILAGVDSLDMPSASGLKWRSRFGDTILLTSQILPFNVLPLQVGGEKFKVMPQKELCAAMKQYEDLEPTPKYLNISQFERNDSGYYVQLQSISCGEFASGGALGIYFKKVADSFVVINRQASSIN
ncbi:MAG: hypothetical protein EOP48_27620 [Sphingobacteriales bacterium]|nr:MAG: hypothetical protein EOP48_27620 [Sphingobacteriales bacterium]